jgi:hypothetical protein
MIANSKRIKPFERTETLESRKNLKEDCYLGKDENPEDGRTLNITENLLLVLTAQLLQIYGVNC